MNDSAASPSESLVSPLPSNGAEARLRVASEAMPTGHRHELAALVARLQEGEEAAWAAFLEGYGARLQRYLLVVARGDHALAQEAYSEALRRIARNVRACRSEAAFWNWLAKVGRSAHIDLCRKRLRYVSMLERLREYRLALAGGRPAEAHLEKALERSLAAISHEARILVEAKYLRACRSEIWLRNMASPRRRWSHACSVLGRVCEWPSNGNWRRSNEDLRTGAPGGCAAR